MEIPRYLLESLNTPKNKHDNGWLLDVLLGCMIAVCITLWLCM